tara:strand:+ start:380 stop:577 length:198 start_codon:yes stop_codon:yes gene_type:complete
MTDEQKTQANLLTIQLSQILNWGTYCVNVLQDRSVGGAPAAPAAVNNDFFDAGVIAYSARYGYGL